MSAANGTISVDGKTLTVVTVDYETYYDNEYTLSKGMNTSEYIRDERFLAHGVGVKIGDESTKWITYDEIGPYLRSIDWSDKAFLAHNTPFDGLVSTHHYGIRPAFYLDTLSMSRAAYGHHIRHNLDTIAKLNGLGGKEKAGNLTATKGKQSLSIEELDNLGSYCIDDVDQTYSIFFAILPYIPADELKLIHITTRMFTEPVLRVDIPRVERELANEIKHKKDLIAASGVSVETLASNNKFAEELRRRKIEPPTKISPTTGESAYAFAKADDGFKALKQHTDQSIRDLCFAREAVKSTIGETRAIRFINAGLDGAKLPVLLNYSGAHTHRWSGGNKMNLQNLKRGGELRRSILAPEGYSIVVCDSSQIEARTLAWLAGQNDLVNSFIHEDAYIRMASAIFNTPYEEITKDSLERFIGKICVLGLGYGMGAPKLQATLRQGVMGPPVDLPLSKCYEIVNKYRRTNNKIRAFWKRMDSVLGAMLTGAGIDTLNDLPFNIGKGFIQLPNGLFLQYFGLQAHEGHYGVDYTYETRSGRNKIYGGLLTENIVQALSRCIIADQMLEIEAAGYRIVTMTHDEIVAICPTEEADICFETMRRIMSTPPNWAKGLPLAAEGGHDLCYSK